MAVTLTATLLGSAEPRRVQLVLAGTTAGQAYQVTGAAGGFTWSIPGGSGTSTGGQVLLVDTRGPLGAQATYTAVVAGVSYTAVVTVPWSAPEPAVLQSLDGLTVAKVMVANPEDERTGGRRAWLSAIGGRRSPVGRIDLELSSTTSWVLEADDADSATVQALLATGAPLVLRTVLAIQDRPPVEIGLPMSVGHSLVGQVGTLRTYDLKVQILDDPEPGTVLGSFTWDDVDTAIGTTRTWDDLDTALTGMTWDQLDAYDWSQL